MKKLELNDPETKSADVVSENIAALQAVFPDAFREGKIDFDVLKQLLGTSVDDQDEKYGLNWHGKRKARQMALTPSTGTLLPCPDDSVDWEKTQNLFIEGDNLEVLKLLQKSYSGRVKVIYIDPPYNTGKDFVYKDDFHDSLGNYLEITGQRVGDRRMTSNTEASGRFHTDWLNMILPRIKLAHTMLVRDGAMFISIDDTEVAKVRMLCDEIFGEENFLACITWERADSPRMDVEFFSVKHDYIVAYARSLQDFKLIRKRYEGDDLPEHFNKTDEEGRTYYLKPLRAMGGQGETRAARPHLYYPIEAPDGTLVYPKLQGGGDGAWRWSRKKLAEEISRIEWTKSANGWSPSYRIYADESAGKPPETILYNSDVGSNRTGTAEVKSLFDDIKTFDAPKPKNLVRRLIEIVSASDGDIVLDFFAGSGTTAHAVLEQNAADNRERRFILVQIPEPLDTESKEQKIAAEFCDSIGKPRNLAEITKERIRRASAKIESGQPMLNGDRGFRAYRLAHSNIRAWEPAASDLEGSLLANAEHIVPGRSEQDILYELLLKLGLDLCVPIETQRIAGKSVHAIGGGALIACLADGLTKDVVESLSAGMVAWWNELSPAVETRVVFKDSGFADDVAKTNMAAILNQNGILDVRSL